MLKIIPLLLVVLLSACGSEPTRRASSQPAQRTPSVDFSGHWELDYSRSDDVDSKLQTMYREWRRIMEKRASGDRRGSSMSSVQVDMSRGFKSVVALAQFADLITDSQVLDIEQSDIDIEIRRENNFALTCVFSKGEPDAVFDELGSEICGFDAHQLLFHIRMPDGLDVQHRVTMSDTRDRLHIATRVDSDKASPFTVNRFYYRFTPLPENYRCEYTLSKGNVCQSGGGK
jgi:hypothetical protein